MTCFRRLIAAALCALAVAGCATQEPASDYKPSIGQAGKDVIWVPTPQALVDGMLDMAKVTPRDHLVDLGAGDGRTVITAAKRGLRARGIEYNPDMVALARRNAQAEGVAGRATFERADIFETDFSRADVVTLFLLPHLNLKLRPTLLAMKPGTRIVSNTFTMEAWEPDQTIKVTQGCAGYCAAYLWIVPADVRGTWRLGEQDMVLTQTYQMVEGTLRAGGRETPVTGRLAGDRITLKAGERQFEGQVRGTSMAGTTGAGAAWSAAKAP